MCTFYNYFQIELLNNRIIGPPALFQLFTHQCKVFLRRLL